MISRLLSEAQLRSLAAAPDLEGVLRSLVETPYGAAASWLLERGASLAGAEEMVVTNLVDAYRRTSLLFHGDEAGLIVEIARRLDLDNLKAILRGKARREPPDAVRPLLIPLGRLSELTIEGLLLAEDVEAAADVLSGTEYGRVLRAALPRYAAEGSLFPVEIALDLNYYRRLWRAVEGLSGQDRLLVERMMGSRYDVLNLEWVIRYRLVYALSPEEILNYTLPFGRRVDAEVIRRSAAADAIDGIAAAVPDPYRSLLAGVVAAADPVEAAGLVLQRYLLEVARSALAGYPFHLGIAVAYLWLKDAEAHDLRAVFEGKRYGRAADSIISSMWGVS